MPVAEGVIAFINNLSGIIGTGLSVYDFFKKDDMNKEVMSAIRKKSEEAFDSYCRIREFRKNIIGEPVKKDVIEYWELCLQRNILPSVRDIIELKIAEKEEAQLLFELLVNAWMELPVYAEWLNGLKSVIKSEEIKKELSDILDQIKTLKTIPYEIDKIQTLSGLVTDITKERIYKAQKDCCEADIRHYFTVDNRFDTMLKVISSKEDIVHEKASGKLFELLEEGNSIIVAGNGGQGKTSLMMRGAILMSYRGYLVLWMNLSATEVITEQMAGHFFDLLQNYTSNGQRILLCIDNPFEGKQSIMNLRERWPSDPKIQLIMAERSNRLSLLSDNDQDVLLHWFDKAKMLVLQGINQTEPTYFLKNYEVFPFAESIERRKNILEKAIYGFVESDARESLTNEIKVIVQSTIRRYTNPRISLVELIYRAAFELQKSISKPGKVKLDWNEWGDFLKREFKSVESESDISFYSSIAAAKFFSISLPVAVYCRYYDFKEYAFKNRLKERMVEMHVEPVIYNQNADTLQPKHDVIAELFFQFNKGKINFNDAMLSIIRVMNENELDILLSHMVNKNDMSRNKNWIIGEIEYWSYMDAIYQRLKKNELGLSEESRIYLCLGFLWSKRVKNESDNKIIEQVLDLYAPEIDETIMAAKLYTEWGIWVSKLGDYKLAEEKFKEVIDNNATSLPPRTELGKLLSKQKGREKEAEKYLLEVIGIDSKNIQSRTELGKLLSKQKGREKEAEKYLLEAIKIDSRNLHPHTELGKLLSKQKGREKEAEKYLLELIGIDSKNVMARTELGKLLSKQNGREKEAEKYLLEVIGIDSKDIQSRTELGKLLSKQKGREKEAEKYLLEVIGIDSKNIMARTELGKLLSKQKGREKEAEKYLLEVIDIDKRSLHGRSVLGRLYEKNNREKALKLYREICAIEPNNIYGLEGLRRLNG